MSDGIAKNWEVVKGELSTWKGEMRKGLARFKGAPWDPRKKDNKWHLIQNLVTETNRATPRTRGYLFTLSVVAGLVFIGLYWLLCGVQGLL